ncbi:MAG: two-component system response regulator [Candidatus Thiodiazotropha sp. (ex Dulcina madagascariensis)]|nr:two-component system response regulator [Candidatus Thiodiazotropha sp. (ex Dulcina madagascariensis)]MCU7926896.1 two-component system response regulator [Candidatus Thiodiazotropha sp. (ex Dulcina madagascariensis)]
MSQAEYKPTILIVDDTSGNIEVLSNTLRPKYHVRAAKNGVRALTIARNAPPPDLILLDIMMPEMDGYETCRRLKADPATALIPVIFITALADEGDEERGLALGAVDYITKPFKPVLVQARVHNQIELKRHRDQLEILVQERTRELQLTQEATIETMGALAEYRDPETGGHIKRTQNYMKLLAETLKDHPRFRNYLDKETIRLLYLCAPLHDIGKVGVSDNILCKPAKLTEQEFEKMKQHTLYGRDTLLAAEEKLGGNSFLGLAREIAEYHHERWDGLGYPHGIAGEQIPICGRLMAIADVYDALISKRVYKPPYPHSRAVGIILQGKGTQFDPAVVDAFLACSEAFLHIALKYADHPEEIATLSEETEPVGE